LGRVGEKGLIQFYFQAIVEIQKSCCN